MSEQTHNWSDIVSGYFLDVIFVTALPFIHQGIERWYKEFNEHEQAQLY